MSLTANAEIPEFFARPKFERAWMEEKEIAYERDKRVVDEATGEIQIVKVPMVKTVQNLMVEYIPNPRDQIGKTKIVKRWDDIVPSADVVDLQDYLGLSVRRRYEALRPHVEAFKRGELFDGKTQGTPLENVEGISESIATMMRRNYEIMSAEDLASATEADMRRVPHPMMRQFVRNAQALLHDKKIAAGVSKVADERMAKLEEENKALRDMFAEFMATQKGGKAEPAKVEPAKQPERAKLSLPEKSNAA